MLNKIRDNSSGTVAKIILFALMFVFAFWGVGDIFRRQNDNEVAKVGNLSISADEYRRTLQETIQSIPGEVDEEILKSYGIYETVLNELIIKKLYNLESKNLNLDIDEKVIVDKLLKNPFFFDSNNKFNKDRLDFFLNSRNLTEKKLLDNLVEIEKIQLIAGNIATIDLYDKKYAELLFNFREEKREADIIYVPFDHVKKVRNPADSDLVAFYENNQNQFVTTERRDIKLVQIDCSNMKNLLKINNDSINQQYEKNIEYYRANNISFDDARVQIEQEMTYEGSCNLAKQNFKSFQKRLEEEDAAIYIEDIAKELKLDVKTLVSIKKNSDNFSPELEYRIFNIKDAEIGKIFSATTNDDSDNDIYYFFTVNNITPSRVPALDEVKGKVIEQWKLTEKRKNSLIFAENFMGNDQDPSELLEVARKNNFTVKTNQVFDRNNSLSLPQGLVSDIFQANQNNKISKIHPSEKDNAFLIAIFNQKIKNDNTGEKYKYNVDEISRDLNDIRKSELIEQYNRYLRTKYKVSLRVDMQNNNQNQE